MAMTSTHTQIQKLYEGLNRTIIGQSKLVTRLLVALLSDGHLLVEGAPGLAKTKAIKDLAERIDASFHRIQFTPDLLPGDLTGTDVFRPEKGEFVFQKGPIFHHLLLADEINRAPAKVQSALLEAMAERQVTQGHHTYDLPELFMVMATQNPIEQEGTYALPEAQLDRFLMYVKIDYPKAEAEQQILQLARQEYQRTQQKEQDAPSLLKLAEVFAARREVMTVHLSSALENYMVELVIATRTPERYGASLKEWLRYGASPRGTIALDRCARSFAWLKGRDYVTPEDVHSVAYDVLRHRIGLSFEAEAEGVTCDQVIEQLLQSVAIP